MTRKTCLHWLITLLIPALIMLIPTSELFTPAMQSMCAVTMLGMLMLCFSLMDSAIVAFILMLGYLVIGIPQKVVFSAWLSDIPWLVLFSLLFVNIVSRTSLLDKMAYIAAQNGRSLNRETQGLIARHVEEFEEEHGPIPPRP